MTTTTTVPAGREPSDSARTLTTLLAELHAIEGGYPNADTDPAATEAAEARCNALARAIAETPATTPADVLAKLALVEMGFRGTHGPHDLAALDSVREAVARMVLPTITSVSIRAPAADDSELLAMLAEIDALTTAFDEATTDDPVVTSRLRHLHNEALPACPAHTLAGVQAKLARAESILAGSAADWSAQMVRSAMADLERLRA